MFSLALVSPIFYLTDDWSPVIKNGYFTTTELNVYEAGLKENVAHFVKIGTLKLDQDFQGPVNVEQIKKMPNFSPAL